jgi:hypothetical protein
MDSTTLLYKVYEKEIDTVFGNVLDRELTTINEIKKALEEEFSKTNLPIKIYRTIISDLQTLTNNIFNLPFCKQ